MKNIIDFINAKFQETSQRFVAIIKRTFWVPHFARWNWATLCGKCYWCGLCSFSLGNLVQQIHVQVEVWWSLDFLTMYPKIIDVTILTLLLFNLSHVVSSVQFSCSVVSDSLRPHELQHARPPCPSPTPGVYSNSCLSSRWCHPAISSSVIPFSSCPQSLLASGSFPMNQLFAWGGQSIGVPASASVHPMNTQDWSPLGWSGWISLQSKGLSRDFYNTIVQKRQFFGAQLSSQSNSHISKLN